MWSWLWAILAALIAISIAVSIVMRRGRRRLGTGLSLKPEGVGQAAERLAMAVWNQWRDEAAVLRIQDPIPINVRWRVVSSPEPVDDAGEAGESSGALAELVARVPSGRLAIIGEPGSGKTSLAIEVVLDLLRIRSKSDAVPVLVTATVWTRDASIESWLEQNLKQDYPFLSSQSGGVSVAAALLRSGRVLPVIDGVDEVEPGSRLRFWQALQNTSLAFVLTSRTDEFYDLIKDHSVLSRTAVVALQPLRPSDVVAHIIAGETPEQLRNWQPLISALQSDPEGSRARHFMRLLSTPLMATLAKISFRGTEHSPADLLDRDLDSDPGDLQDHLMAAWILHAYRRQWRFDFGYHAKRKIQWLAYLAIYMVTDQVVGVAA